MTSREMNCRVFFDTEAWYRSTEKLRRGIKKSISGTRLYKEQDEIALPADKPYEKTELDVTAERTFQCAMRLAKEHPDKKTGVLNFASARQPGGGVRSGAGAQEEALCRCSTLYPALCSEDLKEGFYHYHIRDCDNLYSDSCIYTPDVIICKSDEPVPQRLPEDRWERVDVISCAAPNLRAFHTDHPEDGAPSFSREELLRVHRARAKRILEVAAANKIDYFVSGAHGCGVFMNDPEIVSQAWKEAAGEMDGFFAGIIFAVCVTKRESENYQVFRRVILE